MSRYRFWILYAACLIAAVAVWFLSVPKKLEQIDTKAAELQSLAQRAEEVTPLAVGAKTLLAQDAAIAQARKDLRSLEAEFIERDADNLDLWFPELKISWKKRPSVEDFKRYYLVSTDDLNRALTTAALKLGAPGGATASLIEYPWMRGDEFPDVGALRELQSEFWVQDRLLRAAARFGALATKPMEIGPLEKAVGLGKRLFSRRSYRLFLEVPQAELKRVFRAFDGPFDDPSAARVGGQIGMRVLVNQIGVSRLKLDAAAASRLMGPGGARVQVTFDLTVLDFAPTKGS